MAEAYSEEQVLAELDTVEKWCTKYIEIYPPATWSTRNASFVLGLIAMWRKERKMIAFILEQVEKAEKAQRVADIPPTVTLTRIAYLRDPQT